MRRFVDWWVYRLERFLLRGAIYRLLLMLMLVVFVSVVGGLSLVALGQPDAPLDAIWWAFLRLTDPGYLGDDNGVGRRVVSVVVTICGYVLFMGALIAILTEWLQSTVRWLQRGETPLVLRDHLVILGLTASTPVIIEELMRSASRVRRALRLQSRGDLTIVVLVEDLDEDLRANLAAALGDLWDDQDIILRSGSPLVEEHLERVDFTHAAAIMIPGVEDPTVPAAARDALTVKTLLSIAHNPAMSAAERPPRMIAEIADNRLSRVISSTYPGLELLPTQAIVGRLIAQNLRHSGLSWALGELLASHSGNDLLYKTFEEVNGLTFDSVVLGMEGGLCLGFVRKEESQWVPYLNPQAGTKLESGDRLVLIGESFESIRFTGATSEAKATDSPAPVTTKWPRVRRILALGWSLRTRLMVEELETYHHESFTVDVLSRLSAEDRELPWQPKRVKLTHLHGDYVNVDDIADIDLSAYDNVVIFGRDWLEHGPSADAHTILGALIVRAQLAESADRPLLLVELKDPDNVELFDDHPGEVVLSPKIMGRMMAHAALRPELRAVLNELFTVGGAELHFRRAADLDVTGSVPFSAIQQAARARGEIALGVRTSEAKIDVRGDLTLAPSPSQSFTLTDDTLVMVLTTYASHFK